MGNFYTNITLRGSNQNAIADFLTQKGFNAYVTPTVDDFTVVYEEKCEAQDVRLLEELTTNLSKQFNCPALAVMNHDDDILWYKLFDGGEFLDEYNSSPTYFDATAEPSLPAGGDAEKLCGAFKAAEVAAVEKILRASSFDDYTFEVERHEELANTLGMPLFAVGCGFESVEHDELPEDLKFGDLKKTAS